MAVGGHVLHQRQPPIALSDCPQVEVEDYMQTTRVVVGRVALVVGVVALVMALSAPGSRLLRTHAQTARLMQGISRLPAVRHCSWDRANRRRANAAL